MNSRKAFRKIGLVIAALLMILMAVPAGIFAAPLAPANLAATVAAGPAVNLTWTDVAAEIGYRVMRANAPGTTFTDITAGIGGLPANSVSFSDSTAVAGVTYSYQVVAFDLTGNSPPTNTVTITASVPAAPSGLTAAENAGPPQTVTLSWTDNANNEIGFLIERADNAGFTLNPVRNARVANTAVAPVTFVDADVIPGATYFYRVSALSTSGSSAATAAASITITAAAGMVAGPVPPIAGFAQPNGFPLYYQDTLGTKLNLLPITPVNFADGVIPGNAYSAALGFGSEAFYYLAAPDMTPAGASGITGVIEFAIEAIFGSPTGDAIPTTEAVMARTRIRLTLPVGGDWTIQTPYGTRTFPGIVIGAAGGNLGGATLDINFTEDIGAIPRIFSGANSPIAPFDPVLNPNPINVFLRPVATQLGAPAVFGDGVTPTTVTGGPLRNTVIITGPGVGPVTLSSWTINGKFLSAPVTPSFTTGISPPLGVAFTDTTVGAPTSWLWDFGDGNTSTLQSPVHLYGAAGNYIARLTASNAGGSASTSQMVSVFTQPSADFTTGPGATPLTVNFTSPATGNPTGWLWDFGDGNTSTVQNPAHAYAAAGPYTVTLSVFNPAGTATASQQIVVGPPLVPTSVTATVASTTQVDVSWTDNALNETGFRLDRAEDATFTLNLLSRDVAASAGSGLTVTFNDATGIVTNKMYFYRVFAVSATGISDASATAQVTVGGPPPNKPALTATLLSATSIKIDWTDPNTNEDFQHLHRDTVATFNSPNLTHTVLPANTITFTDSTVVAGQTYFYFVHAMNNLGDSPDSDTLQISTTVPAAPTGLAAAIDSPTSITLTWTAGISASGYNIQRATDGATFSQIGTATATTFTDTTVAVGNTYTYRVFSTNVIGTSATASTTATANMLPPAAPALNPGTAQATGEVVLTWSNVANEIGYRIERSSNNGTTFILLATVNADVVTYTDTGAAPSTAYAYQVTSFNGLGSTASNTVSVTSATPTTAPAAPTNLVANAVASNTVTLTWTDNAVNEAGFRVERSTDGTTFTVVSTAPVTNDTTFSDATAVQNTVYTYRVFAVNVAGASATAAVAAPVTTPTVPPASGGGGGGGGTAASPNVPVSLSGFSSGAPLTLNSSGIVTAAARLQDTAGTAALDIPAGTVLKTSDGGILASISVTAPPAVPDAPAGQTIVAAREFGPTGATFSPAITITLKFDPAQLPQGVDKTGLVIAFWDGTKWVNLDATVDAANNTVSAQISHFTTFAVVAPVPTTVPPTTTAAPVPPATTPSVTTPVTPVPSTPAVTTPPATTQPPAVTTPPATTAPVTPAPAAGTNWVLIGGIVVAVIVLLVLAISLMKRKPVNQ